VRVPWLRCGAFWVTTAIIVWEEFAGATWMLLQIEYVRSLFRHLGYPPYVLTILGTARGVSALAILLPSFPRSRSVTQTPQIGTAER
jgi:DoxX-like family